MRKAAMPWMDDGRLPREKANPVSVRRAGFKGFVGDSYAEQEARDHHSDDWDENEWENSRPEPNRREMEHYEQHEEFPDSYHRRHEKTYFNRMKDRLREDIPDHADDHLGHFVTEHGSRDEWERGGGSLQKVDLSKGVWATQSHVAQFHIDRYKNAPNAQAWYMHHGGGEENHYIGNYHPMFVTHQGRLHAVDGHHRVAAAIQRGDSHIVGWHFDLDKHPINSEYDLHTDRNGQRTWSPTGNPCEDCRVLHHQSPTKMAIKTAIY